jgi:hypothetical protein
MRMGIRLIRPILLGLAIVLMAAAVHAQPPDPATRIKRDQLERDFAAAFNSGDLAESERLLREWVTLRPMDFVPVYNLACVLAMQGKADEGSETLLKAVSLGFCDRRVLERDPNLSRIRSTEGYRNLLASWPRVLDKMIDERIERARAGFSRRYVFEKDDDLRLGFASGFPKEDFAAARGQATRLVKWWQTQVLPEGAPAVVTEGESPDPWVLVILPTTQDFESWAARNFPRQQGA